MKVITITLKFEADELPLDEFAKFLEFVTKDIDAIEQKVKERFPRYEVKDTAMQVNDLDEKR